MRAPLAVATATTTLILTLTPATAFAGGIAGEAIERSDLVALARFSDLQNSEVVALIIDAAGIAQNTDRTTLESSKATGLVNQKSDPEFIHAAGDYYVDAEVGLVLVHATAGLIVGSQFVATDTVDYHPLVGAASTQHKYVHAIGPVRPGDELTYDGFSNFAKATAGDIVVGRVLAVETQPKGLLDRVSTAWNSSSFSAAAKMPGSATKGFTDMITLSSETVADQIITMNVRV